MSNKDAKPKAPKKRNPKPNCKSGRVKEKKTYMFITSSLLPLENPMIMFYKLKGYLQKKLQEQIQYSIEPFKQEIILRDIMLDDLQLVTTLESILKNTDDTWRDNVYLLL